MRYREIINELFIQPAEWTIHTDQGSYKTYRFTVGNVPYSMDIMRMRSGKFWGVAFDVITDDDNDYKMTGTGNATVVFATVLDIMKHFIQQEQPNRIEFSADRSEPSRIALYRRMLGKLAPSAYTTTEEPQSDAIRFIMQRNDLQEDTVNELAGVKRYANMTATEIKQYYERELGDGSIKLLGSGAHAAAIQIGNNVYKMWMQDSAYLDFVHYALNHQDNPALPKFLSKIKRMPAFFIRHKDAPDYVNYIKMEKLTPFNPEFEFTLHINDPHAAKVDGFCSIREVRSAIKRMPETNDPVATFCKMMAEGFDYPYEPKHIGPDLRGVITALYDIMVMSNANGHKFDLHNGNFMMRGNQVVILDPIFNSMDLELNSKFEVFDQQIEGEDLDDLEARPDVKMPRAANSIQFTHTKTQ